jgi:hypothetical protein
MSGFSLDKAHLTGAGMSKPGLEALRKAEFATAKGMDALTRGAEEAAAALVKIGGMAAVAPRAEPAAAVKGGAARGALETAQQIKVAGGGAAGGGGLAVNFGKEMDRVGGAIITMFRRIDASMKFPIFDRKITEVRGALDRFAQRGAAEGAKVGAATAAALQPVPQILAEMGVRADGVGRKFRLAAAAAGLVKKTWEGIKSPAVVNNGPPAGQRPGRGRAVPLAGSAQPKGLSPDEQAWVDVTKTIARAAVALGRFGTAADAAFGVATARGTMFGAIMRGVGLGVARFPLEFSRGFAGLTSILVGAGQGVFRFRNFVQSLGDVAGKTFSRIFREGGPLRTVFAGGTNAAGGLFRSLLKIGTLGVFSKASREARQFRAAAQSSVPVIGDLTSALRGMAGQVLVAFGAFGAVYQAVEFFKSGVKGAVDLNETVSAAKVTFGDFAGGVLAYADKMAARFGLVKNETIGVANGFGDMAGAARLTGQAASDFALRMTQLSADLMSFKNIPFDEAAQKIQSALAGEAEPLRRFGVLMTEDMVKAQMLTGGMTGLSGAIGGVAARTSAAADAVRSAGAGYDTLGSAAERAAVKQQTAARVAAGAAERAAVAARNSGKAAALEAARQGLRAAAATREAADRAAIARRVAIRKGLEAGPMPPAPGVVRPEVKGPAVGGVQQLTTATGEQAKIMARATLISRGLWKATGDLERTQGDAANQFRKAGGGLQNFATSVGEILMPAVKAGVVAFNEFLAAVVGAFEAAKPAITGFVAKAAKAFEFAGALARNYDLTWQLVVIKFREGMLNMVAIMGVIPDNLATIGGYVANNFTRLITDAIKYVGNAVANMTMNLGALGTAAMEWAKNPFGGFQFTWIPFSEGFKATVDKFPELMKPVWADLSADSKKVWDEFQKREDARKKAMGGAAAPFGETPGPLAAVAKKGKKENVLASLAELNSKEAYTAIAKAKAGGVESETKKVAALAAQQLGVQKKIAAGIDRIAGNGGGATWSMA